MSAARPEELVLHCSVRNDAGMLVERLLLRVPPDAAASTVLATVLRVSLAQRRLGRTLTVDAPAEVVALLRFCGLTQPGSDVSR